MLSKVLATAFMVAMCLTACNNATLTPSVTPITSEPSDPEVSLAATTYEWGQENAALPLAPSGKSWKLNTTFTDDFQYWNSSKWQAKHDYWDGSGTDRPGAFVMGQNAGDTPNVKIKNSKLMLYARANGPSGTKWIGTSVVASKSKLSYGYYEVKMKASRLSTTSSFWMQGKYSELDVVEAIGAPKKGAEDFAKTMPSNFHYFPNGFGGAGYQQNPSRSSNISNGTSPEGAAYGWHTYGMWWRSNREAYFYLDGKRITNFHLYTSDPASWNKTWDKLYFPADFNEQMTLFFDTEVWNWGGGSPGLPTLAELNATDDSNAMQVEWVRAYTLQ
jgi:beta-porphyranase